MINMSAYAITVDTDDGTHVEFESHPDWVTAENAAESCAAEVIARTGQDAHVHIEDQGFLPFKRAMDYWVFAEDVS